MANRIRLTTEAYHTIGFHGMKYPSNPIFGFLLGTEKNGTVIEYWMTAIMKIDIQKSYPVSHNVPLAPILELSAEMAEKQNSSLKILGIYYGAESNSISMPVPQYVERIATNIRTVEGECAVLQLKAENLSDHTKNYLEAMKPLKIDLIEDLSSANNSFVQAIETNFQHRFINDFEDLLNSSGQYEVK